MRIGMIAVGIIRNARRELLIARRPAEVHMGGFWEFPGGKVELGESPEQTLYRELREETRIDVEHADLLAMSQHQFADRQLEFYFFLVEKWRGTAYSNEGQSVRWWPQQVLNAEEFSPANSGIIRQLTAD